MVLQRPLPQADDKGCCGCVRGGKLLFFFGLLLSWCCYKVLKGGGFMGGRYLENLREA